MLSFLGIIVVATVSSSQNNLSLKDSLQREYEARIKLSRIDDIYVPADIYDAFKELDKKSTAASKEKYAGAPEDKIAELMRFRLGFWMKQNWGLVQGSRLTHSLRDFGIQTSDEAVDFILIAWHRHLNQKEPKLTELGNEFSERRKKAFEEKMKNAKVIHEETRKLSKEEINELLEQKGN